MPSHLPEGSIHARSRTHARGSRRLTSIRLLCPADMCTQYARGSCQKRCVATSIRICHHLPQTGTVDGGHTPDAHDRSSIVLRCRVAFRHTYTMWVTLFLWNASIVPYRLVCPL